MATKKRDEKTLQAAIPMKKKRETSKWIMFSQIIVVIHFFLEKQNPKKEKDPLSLSLIPTFPSSHCLQTLRNLTAEKSTLYFGIIAINTLNWFYKKETLLQTTVFWFFFSFFRL